MARRSLRRAGSLAATILLVGLGGCTANEPSTDLVEPTFGFYSLGPMHIGSPVLVRSENGATASLVAGIVNRGPVPDELASVSAARLPDNGVLAAVPTSREALVADLGGGVPLPVSSVADIHRIGMPGGHSVVFHDVRSRLPAGAFAAVTFNFRRYGAVTIPVLVLPPREFLAPYAPDATSTRGQEL